MNKDIPREYYLKKKAVLESQLERVSRYRNRISLLRLGAFIIGLVSVYLAATLNSNLFIISAVMASGFLVLVKQYGKLSSQHRHLENLLAVNIDEMKAMDGDYSGFARGDRYMMDDDEFTSDLDIFGKGSLFQFLNRTATIIGEERLASNLSSPLTDKQEIVIRQKAVEELAGEMEWCQEFMATGREIREDTGSRSEMLEWINEPASFRHPVYKLLLVIVPALAFFTVYKVSNGDWPFGMFLVYLLVPFSIIGGRIKTLNRKHAVLGRKSAVMGKYGRLLALLEQKRFNAERLSELHRDISTAGTPASRSIKKLSRIMAAFDNRLNMIAGFLLNVFFLWDIRQVIRLEKWQERHKEKLPTWFDVLAELDCLCSMGVFRFNHPHSIFPEVKSDGSLIHGRDVYHPLIPSQQNIPNDIACPGWKHMTIITGANMAGKSTYLRMVGVSLVLAMAGFPVLAKEFSFIPVRLISGIRTRDSLQKRESYFYAELKRLKLIIDELEKGEALFVLLDEVLKGTNSKDKLAGSLALIKKLLNYQVSGMIATHDLALAELEREFKDQVDNRSFEVVIKDDLLEFDYKLKDGVAKMMNATFLMEKMGITGTVEKK